jgi:serine phosphatase RsbU (regulator of sigma subunit)
MPVMHLGEVLAIVWLENKHLAQAFTEERMELLNILAAQGAISLKNTEYLLKIPEKIRLESQLAAAQDVQKALLPKTPAPPEVSIALHHRAAERIGGDWLSYEMDEEASYLYLCIGDISGAGIPSALLTAAAAGAVKAAISNISRRHPAHSMADRLKIIAQSVNKTVRDTGNPSGRSMTMIFVVLDLTTGHGFFLNAGHIPILHFKKNQTSSLIVPGSLLGEHANPTFETKAFTLSQGDCLFLYTNGLLQNLGIDDHPLHHLALRRLLQTKIQKKQKEPTEVVKELLDQLDKKGALIAPKDDCSFLIIKLKDFRLNHKVKKPA